jgi:hypothetical protein
MEAFPRLRFTTKSSIEKCPASPSETNTSPNVEPYPGPVHLTAWCSSCTNIRSIECASFLQNAEFSGSTVI